MNSKLFSWRRTPANSGNFNYSAEITVYGGLDPDDDSNYAAIADAHTALCGNMGNYLTGTLANSALEGTASGYTNNLEVY
jgi:hypothetical protein